MDQHQNVGAFEAMAEVEALIAMEEAAVVAYDVQVLSAVAAERRRSRRVQPLGSLKRELEVAAAAAAATMLAPVGDAVHLESFVLGWLLLILHARPTVQLMKRQKELHDLLRLVDGPFVAKECLA